MNRTTLRRTIAAATAAAALLGLTAPPASASAVDSDTLVFVPFNGQTVSLWRNGNLKTEARVTTQIAIPGNFNGSPGTDLFLYGAGEGADGVLHVTPNGSNFTTSFRSESILNGFVPIPGDYNGDGIDDIFWYRKGPNVDPIWLFKEDGSHSTVTKQVSGDYKPTAINIDGDGDTDLIWYAPGTGADSVWVFGGGATHVSKPLTINGNYQLIPGHFSDVAEGSPQRRLYFWNKSGPDSIWTFDTSGNHTSAAVPNVDGAFEPVVGKFTTDSRDAVLFYKAGTGSERFISFNANGSVNQLEPPTVNGTYDPVVGDFDGNGFQDIAWTNSGKATLWKFNGGGFTQATVTTSTPNTFGAVIANFLFPA